MIILGSLKARSRRFY